MTTRTKVIAFSVAAFAALAFAACDDDTTTPPSVTPPPTPAILSLSRTAVAVGDELRFTGSGFIDPEQGYTVVTFRGVYSHDGVEEQVNRDVRVSRVDDATVSWLRFGPYRIPFTAAGNQLGTFSGEVFATNYTNDGREQRQTAPFQAVSIEVLPSLIVRDMNASGDDWSSDCVNVGTRLVNYVPYRVSVEAVGFDAEEFTYTVSSGLLDWDDQPSSEPTTFTHVAGGSVDSLGDVELIRFAEVPLGVPVYRASISVVATSATGDRFEQLLMMTVHQPLFVRYRGGVEVAEMMEPEPVSSCMPGGSTGRDVAYSEQTTDTRTISTSNTLTQGWQNSYTEQHTDSYGESGSEANAIGFSSSDTETWNWNVHGDVMVGAEGGFGPFAKAKAEVRVGGGHDWGGSSTETTTGQQTWTQTSSYSEAISLTEQNQESISQAMTVSQTDSTSYTTSLGYRGYLLPNQYGVFYRQTTRLIRRAEIIAMDLCGNETIVGEFIMNDYTWAPDLAMDALCPPFPESALPEAQCLIPPCEEVQ
jgi:hypothetical protein